MPNCAIENCTNYNRKTKGTDIKYFRFPKNEDLVKQWVIACRRKDKINLKNACVCSLHFEDKYINIPLKHKLLEYSPKNYRILSDDAVPTKNLPRGTRKEEVEERSLRVAKQSRLKTVVDILKSAPSTCEISEEKKNFVKVEELNNTLEEEEIISKMEFENENIELSPFHTETGGEFRSRVKTGVDILKSAPSTCEISEEQKNFVKVEELNNTLEEEELILKMEFEDENIELSPFHTETGGEFRSKVKTGVDILKSAPSTCEISEEQKNFVKVEELNNTSEEEGMILKMEFEDENIELSPFPIETEGEVRKLKERIDELEKQNCELLEIVKSQDSIVQHYEDAMAKIYTQIPKLLDSGT